MCSGLYSDFKTKGVVSYSSNKNMQTKENSTAPIATEKNSLNSFERYAPAALSIASIPLTALIVHKIDVRNLKPMYNLDNRLNQLEKSFKDKSTQLADEVEKLKETTQKLSHNSKETKEDNSKIWGMLFGLAGMGGAYKLGELTSENKQLAVNRTESKINNIESTAHWADSNANSAMWHANQLEYKVPSLIDHYTNRDIEGISLLQNVYTNDKNITRYNEAIEQISNSANKKLGIPEIPLSEGGKIVPPSPFSLKTNNPTIWSVTSEYNPISEGGLGVVPVEIQDNMLKLGVNNLTFIPMYQQDNKATLIKEGDEYIYNYNDNKKYSLKKAAAFKMETYRKGKTQTENVEVFYGKDGNRPLIFIKNDNYFNGGIYQKGLASEEPEKFAFFSKAVYELAKMKENPRFVRSPEICDKDAFNEIKTPDGLILNDWQASPIAALMRYKAPMEFAYQQLDEATSKKLSDMRIITIGHNTVYQGSTNNNNDERQKKESTSNILNTLFDEYAYDIVKHSTIKTENIDKNDKGLENLNNVLLIDKGNNAHTNLLNMGVCLSDYFCPVSQNFADEIISDEKANLSGELRWALTRRSKDNGNGTLIGIINGNDFEKNKIAAKKNFIKNNAGFEFELYDKNTKLSDVLKARKSNKERYYNEFIVPFVNGDTKNIKSADNAMSRKMELVRGNNTPDLEQLTSEQLENTPIISSIGRLVDQKGIDKMCEAIDMLYKNWDKDFPGKNKPIFYIGGPDGENGAQRAKLQTLVQETLNPEDAKNVIFCHGKSPMPVMTSAADFFLLPSKFEPCGLTQGEAFAVGTPVIASSVGGIVDTVNRDKNKQNGVLTVKEAALSSNALYNAMKEGLNIFYDDKQKYQAMVNNALQEDFSWIQKDKNGNLVECPMLDYLNLLGISNEKLKEIKAEQNKQN